jgi:hypothetical protein
MAALEEERGQGRNECPVRAVWNSILAGVVFQHVRRRGPTGSRGGTARFGTCAASICCSRMATRTPSERRTHPSRSLERAELA